MDIRASEHWGKMGIWGKCTPGKMSTRANQQLGQIGTLEQMGILGLMDIRADGHGPCWGQGVRFGGDGDGVLGSWVGQPQPPVPNSTDSNPRNPTPRP